MKTANAVDSDSSAYPRYVGSGTPFKRCWTADHGHGFTADPADPAADGWTVYLDAGGTFVLRDAAERATAIDACTGLNDRTWSVVLPEMHVEGFADPITAPGRYPVFVARDCIPYGFGRLLAVEMAALRKRHAWSLYHSSEGDGEWNSDGMGSTDEMDADPCGGEEGAHSPREKTEVHVLYGAHRCDALPFQNPCGVKHQWSHTECLKDPYIEMPPVCRMLRDLLVLGNPAVVSVFDDLGMGEDYLGLAAFTEYRHKNSLVEPFEDTNHGSTSPTAALAWHYDKSLGIETACISVPICLEQKDEIDGGGSPPRMVGHKTIGLGGRNPVEGGCGSNTPGTFRTMPMPVNSFWCANAKAIYHAVGNDDERSATIVLRTLVPKRVYDDVFFHRGARHLTRLLRNIQRRFFPILKESDVDAARARASQVYRDEFNLVGKE
eukprot:g261.t1